MARCQKTELYVMRQHINSNNLDAACALFAATTVSGFYCWLFTAANWLLADAVRHDNTLQQAQTKVLLRKQKPTILRSNQE